MQCAVLQQDGYFPGDSHQQWDADDIGYLDDDKHDDLEAAPNCWVRYPSFLDCKAKPTDSKEAGWRTCPGALEQYPRGSSSTGSLKGEAAAEALLYFDDTADELAGFKVGLVCEQQIESTCTIAAL